MNTLTELLWQDGKLWVVVVVIMIVLAGWLYAFLQIGRRAQKVKQRLKR